MVPAQYACPLLFSRKVSAAARSPGALAIAQPPHPPAESFPIAVSNFSLAPLPVDGFDSQGSSSWGRAFTPRSADLMWHLMTPVMYLVSAFATPSSHFPVAASDGTKPVSSP